MFLTWNPFYFFIFTWKFMAYWGTVLFLAPPPHYIFQPCWQFHEITGLSSSQWNVYRNGIHHLWSNAVKNVYAIFTLSHFPHLHSWIKRSPRKCWNQQWKEPVPLRAHRVEQGLPCSTSHCEQKVKQNFYCVKCLNIEAVCYSR